MGPLIIRASLPLFIYFPNKRRMSSMNKTIKKWFLMLVSIVTLSILATGCGSSASNTASTQDTSLKGKKVLVGIGTYAPFFIRMLTARILALI